MIYEGVTFNASAVLRMRLDEFVELHLPLFWKDRDEQTRRKMLSEVHAMIRPARKKGKNKE